MSSFGYDLLGFGANASGSGGDPVDDEFNRVSFLAHMEGANNGVNNAFDDGSASNHTITAVGKATQGSFGPFAREEGYWGVAFPRIDNDHQNISVAGTSDSAFGTGDFTVEVFVFVSVVPSSSDYANIFDFRIAANTNQIDLYFGNTSKRLIYFAGGSDVFTSSTDLPINEWTHLALVRASGTTTLYQNGVSVGSASDSNNFAAGRFIFGSRYTDSYGMTGAISNTRVVKGTAVYTSNFTPTTSPLTAITNTVFLSAQSNRFVDNSASAHTMLTLRNPSISAFGPFLTDEVYDPAVNGASLYAPTYADYLRIPNSAEFELDGDFSVEFWANLDEAFNNQLSIFIWANNNSQTQIGQEDSRDLYFYRGSNIIQNTNVITQTKAWNHVALCRSGSVLSMYCNGVRIGTASYTSTVDFSDGYVAAYDPAQGQYAANGYMSDLRILKGSSAYDASQTTLTVPTAPLTAITNTKLLLNMADGQAIDSAAQDVLNFEGGAKISTGQAKFGDTSLYLSNSGNPKPLVEIYNSKSRAFGTGDFTVETWIYIDGTPSQYAYIFDMRHGSSSPIDATEYTWSLAFNYMGSATDDELQWASNNTGPNAILRAAYPPISEWVHIAVCRSGTTTRMFYNGTQSAINTSDSSDMRDTGQYGTIGARFSDESHIDAYFDDIRFSKMARYTNNFTAPTAPFADKGQ